MNRAALLLAVLSACGSADPDTQRGGAGATTDSAASYVLEGDEVSGAVVDATGQPVVDVFVTVSTDFCIPDRTDASGAFTVGRVAPGVKRLITYGETASNGIHASVAFSFEADGPHEFAAPIHTPRLDESYAFDASVTEDQVFETVDGLTLTIAPGALEIAPLSPQEIQVARVALDQTPDFVPEGVVLHDLFVLHPILSFFDPPAPVAFPADPTLTPGTAVTFWALDYDLGELVSVAAGTVDANGRPTTNPGEGIPELTWIAISVE